MPSINTELGERALSKMQHEMDWKPLKERCLRMYPTWSTRHVDRILREYHRFLALKVATRDVYDTIVLAPALLDSMWQQHILSTQQYSADCQLLLQSNQILHYNVDSPVNVSTGVRDKRMQLTKASLCMMFAGTSHFDKDAKGIWNYEYPLGQNDATSIMDSALSSVGNDDEDEYEREGVHLLQDANEEEERRPPSLPPLPAPTRSRHTRKTRTRHQKPQTNSKPHQHQQQQPQHLEQAPEQRRLLYIYRAGKVSKLLAYPYEIILHVKHKIQRKTGIPPQQQYLEWNGLELEEQRTIDHYGIPNDATLVLTQLRSIPHQSSSHTESRLSDSAKLPDESQTDTHRDDHHDDDLLDLDVEARDDPDRRLKRRGQSSSSSPLHSSSSLMMRPPKPPRHPDPHQQHHPYSPSDDSYLADPRRRQLALLNKIKLQNHLSSSVEKESTMDSHPRTKPTLGMSHTIDVFVNTIMGFTINITAKASDTVDRLKQMIEEQEDIPFSKQILILDGVPLIDAQLLTDYTNSESLHVLLRLQAGTASVTASSLGSPSSIMAAAVTRERNQNKLMASRAGV
jgi:Ubiquitin family